MRRSWISAFATAWLGLALAILRAAHVFLASPSQEILSGLWGGLRFSCFTYFSPFYLYEPPVVGPFCGWFLGLECIFLLLFAWCTTSFCDDGHSIFYPSCLADWRAICPGHTQAAASKKKAELRSLSGCDGLQRVSALKTASQWKTLFGHSEKDFQLLGWFSITNVVYILKQHCVWYMQCSELSSLLKQDTSP